MQSALRRSLGALAHSLIALLTCISLFGSPVVAHGANGDCGQPSSDGGSPVATDALFILGAAVGIQICELCVCDVTDDGATTATDALTTLAAAVGQPVSLTCPSCGGGGGFCFQSSAPSCGGTCDEGLSCLPDPESPDECSCLNACEASAAPTCGGSCESEDPSAVCTPLIIAPTGLDPISICECLPPGAVFCAGAQAPECDGECGANAVCEAGIDGCRCTSQPEQPECSAAAAPDCFGTCSSGPEGDTICESNQSGGCVCVPFTGQNETCFDADAPTCGGVCTRGDLCAVESGECECLPSCEVGTAPSCGGDCPYEGETCVVTTITVGQQAMDFCECWEVDR